MIVTSLASRLGIRAPIIQAPMAGGPSSPELVAACSAAGALGSFGFAYTQPEEMRKQASFVRSKTDRPFGINLFVSPQPGAIDEAAQRGALEAVARFYKELGLAAPEPVRAPYAPDLQAQLGAVEDIKPRVLALWAGQAAPLSRALPAAELIGQLERESIEAINAIAKLCTA